MASEDQGNSVTRMLQAAQQGSDSARNQLYFRLLTELRSIASGLNANEPSGQSLTTSALLNEALVQLWQGEVIKKAPDRRYLFGAAIRAMRQILVDHARQRNALKRGGGYTRQPASLLDNILDRIKARYGFEFEPLNHALDRLGDLFPRQREVIELRFFLDLPVQQIAEDMGVSVDTVKRDWRAARAWLRRELQEND